MKNVRALIKKVGADPEVTILEDTLVDMQEIVGGYVEALDITKGITLWLNDEGKLAHLPPNFCLVNDYGEVLDVIVGDVIFTGSDQEGTTTDLTEEAEAQVRYLFSLYASDDEHALPALLYRN